MADIDQLVSALQGAHAAGDERAATVLASEIKNRTSKPGTPDWAAYKLLTDKGLNDVQKATLAHLKSGNADWGNPLKVLSDVGLSLSPTLALGKSAVAGIGGLIAGADQGADAAGKTVQAIQSIGEPTTQAGQAVRDVVTYPFAKLGEIADVAGGKVTDVTGSPALGAGVNTAIQAAPMLLGAKKAAGKVAAREEAQTAPIEQAAEERAKAFVQSKTSLSWDKLSQGIKSTLTDIAKDAQALDKLNPQAVERQAKLKALDIPATKGQLERNIGQRTLEENLSKSESGQRIRDIYAEQDERLHGALDTLRGESGAKAETRSQIGRSVQDEALRKKMEESKANYDALYAKARKTEPNARVSAIPLRDFLKKNPEAQHLGFLKYWLGKAEGTEHGAGNLTLAELHDLREKAGEIANTGGTTGYYAGKVVRAIDDTMAEVPAAAKAWKEANAAYAKHMDEFADQGAVRKLSSDKTKSDRSVALEDTVDHILRSPTEDIGKIFTSLTKGGSKEAQARGAQAVNDIRGGVIDYLKEKAAGKGETLGEKNQKQFGKQFIKAFNELDKDGKIDAIFSKEQAAKLRQINEAAGIVRDEPAGRVSGSDTVPRLMAMLDRVAQIPALGPVAAGAVKLGKKAYDAGKEGRQANQAVTATPLSEGLKASKGTKPKPRYSLSDAANQEWPR